MTYVMAPVGAVVYNHIRTTVSLSLYTRYSWFFSLLAISSTNSGLIESKTSVKTRSIDDFDLDDDDDGIGAGFPVSVS
jgi:hypothetical protein